MAEMFWILCTTKIKNKPKTNRFEILSLIYIQQILGLKASFGGVAPNSILVLYIYLNPIYLESNYILVILKLKKIKKSMWATSVDSEMFEEKRFRKYYIYYFICWDVKNWWKKMVLQSLVYDLRPTWPRK